MKHLLITSLLAFGLFSINGFSQNGIFGKWVTIDDASKEKKSIVEIYEKDGKVYGKIVKLYRKPGENPDPVCDECDEDDPRYKQKIIGMEVITGLKKNDDVYSDGEILDPKEGKIYDCKIWLEDEKLMVRGYLYFFFRTQTWTRAK